MNPETLLGETLRSYAAHAPEAAGLLDAVRDRIDRHRRARTLATTGVATAVVVALVATALVVRTPADDREPVMPAEPSVLAPPSFELPTFPFTPGWEPPGAGEPYALVDGPVASLVVRHVDGREPLVDVDVEQPGTFVLAERYTLRNGGGPETVRGHPAGFFSIYGRAGVHWRDDTGRLVVVSSARGLSFPTLMRFAEELQERPFPVRSPVTLDLVPRGAVPVTVTPGALTFALAPDRSLAPDGSPVAGGPTLELLLLHPDRAAAWRRSVEGRLHDQQDEVRVGSHDGLLMQGPTGRTLHVFLSDEFVLHVRERGTPVLSRNDLLRFAAGVRLTPYASFTWEPRD
ncbi:MAG TPA: hypothetical protein VKY81_03925 [Natronosporangium sp.]|nr:hypothetical protein [Natronosporangium sp.]